MLAMAGSHHASLASSHPGEDLAALGEVPVAEGPTRDARVGGPRAPAEHTVGIAEEHLRVLAVGVGEKPVAAEAGVSTPTRLHAGDCTRVLGPGRRRLPLSLVRQARACARAKASALNQVT